MMQLKDKQWMQAMRDERTTLANKKEIWISTPHFDCDWVTVSRNADKETFKYHMTFLLAVLYPLPIWRF